MENQQPSDSARFKINVLGLINYVKSIIITLNENGNNALNPFLMSIAYGIIDNTDNDELIHKFITNSYPYWNKVHDKDLSFFIDNASSVFGKLQINDVNAFKIVLESKRLDGSRLVDDDDIEDLWKYFTSLVKISIKYIHNRRKPIITCPDKMTTSISYTDEYLSHINVQSTASLFNIVLISM